MDLRSICLVWLAFVLGRGEEAFPGLIEEPEADGWFGEVEESAEEEAFEGEGAGGGASAEEGEGECATGGDAEGVEGMLFDGILNPAEGVEFFIKKAAVVLQSGAGGVQARDQLLLPFLFC